MFVLYVVGRLWPVGGAGRFTTLGGSMGIVPGILFILAMVAVTLLLSRLIFLAVERPSMRRWARSRRTGPPRPDTTRNDGDGGETTPAAVDEKPGHWGSAAA